MESPAHTLGEPQASASLPAMRSGRPRCWGICVCLCVCDCLSPNLPSPQLLSPPKARKQQDGEVAASTPHPGSLHGLVSQGTGHHGKFFPLRTEGCSDRLLAPLMVILVAVPLAVRACVCVCVRVCVCVFCDSPRYNPTLSPGPLFPSQ